MNRLQLQERHIRVCVFLFLPPHADGGVIGKRQTVIISDDDSDQETIAKPSGKPRMCYFIPLPEILGNHDTIGKRASRVVK